MVKTKALGVLSGKGGVGKTTIVANLGATLTKYFNKKVMLLDGNIKASHLGLHLGLYSDLPTTLQDVLSKNVPLTYATFIHQTGIRLIPTPLNGEVSNISRLKEVVKRLEDKYEAVILDCAPGLGKEVVTIIKAIDEAAVVTTPDVPAIADALKTINLLDRFKKKNLGIIVNRVKNEKYELTTEEIESTCNCKIICKIPEDRRVPESIAIGMPVTIRYPRSPASISLKKLAANLIGEIYAPESFLDKVKRFLGI